MPVHNADVAAGFDEIADLLELEDANPVRVRAYRLRALASRASAAGRLSLAIAAQYAEPLAAYLGTMPGVGEVVVAGSYRRCKETVGNLDILVTFGRRGTVGRPLRGLR